MREICETAGRSEAGSKEIVDRLKRMGANAQGRAQLQADHQARSASAKIVLGDAAHPPGSALCNCYSPERRRRR